MSGFGSEFSGGGSVDSPTLANENSFLSGDGASGSLGDVDRRTARQLWGMLKRAQKWRDVKGLATSWGRWWNDWQSKQWQRNRAAGLSMAVINMLYEICETFVGHVTDDIPDMVARPRHPDNIKAAQLATRLAGWIDDSNGLKAALEKPVRSAVITGTGVRRIDWDETMFSNRGGVRQRFVDEFNFFVSPHATSLEDAAYVLEARNVPVSFVRDCWERGGEVKPGIWDGTLKGGLASEASVPGYEGPYGDSNYGAFTATDGSATQITPAKSAFPGQGEKDMCTLIEAWIRQTDQSLRYIACANGIVLQDGPSPYDDDAYPYAVYGVLPSKDSAYGCSLFMFVEKMQREINEMHSFMIDAQKFESDSPLVINQANLEEGRQVDNLPGQILVDRTPDGRGYYLLTKPGANGQYLNIQEYVSDKLREISGNVDVLRGEKPPGVTTLGGMEIIRDEANVLINKMAKHVSEARRRETTLGISRLKQFMKDERVIRLQGSGGREEFVTVNERTTLDVSGEWRLENTLPEGLEVDVDWSPTPPGGPQAQQERALALFGAGLYDNQAALEAMEEDEENIQAILQRQSKAAEQAAKAEAAAKGGASQVAEEDTGSLKERLLGQLF